MGESLVSNNKVYIYIMRNKYVLLNVTNIKSMVGLISTASKYGPVAGSCEEGNEPQAVIFNQQRDYQLLK
jgi:hypothetical protein